MHIMFGLMFEPSAGAADALCWRLGCRIVVRGGCRSIAPEHSACCVNSKPSLHSVRTLVLGLLAAHVPHTPGSLTQ